MKVKSELVETVQKYMKNRLESTGIAKQIGTRRIDLKHIEHLKFQGTLSEENNRYTVMIDEPITRGGTAEGPSPLSYFLLGAGSCFLMQWARLAIAEELDVDEIQEIVRGHVDLKTEGRFLDFIFDISLSGSESAETIKRVAKKAQTLCVVHNTLRLAAPLTTNVKLNGKLVYSETIGEQQPAGKA